MLDRILAALLGVDSLDERFIAHRHMSSRLALGVAVTLMAGWASYDLMMHDRIHTDLLFILAATAVVKVLAMAWFRLTR